MAEVTPTPLEYEQLMEEGAVVCDELNVWLADCFAKGVHATLNIGPVGDGHLEMSMELKIGIH